MFLVAVICYNISYYILVFAALFAVKKGVSPVIIDNTNTQAWEMLAYVEMVSYLILLYNLCS